MHISHSKHYRLTTAALCGPSGRLHSKYLSGFHCNGNATFNVVSLTSVNTKTTGPFTAHTWTSVSTLQTTNCSKVIFSPFVSQLLFVCYAPPCFSRCILHHAPIRFYTKNLVKNLHTPVIHNRQQNELFSLCSSSPAEIFLLQQDLQTQYNIIDKYQSSSEK